MVRFAGVQLLIARLLWLASDGQRSSNVINVEYLLALNAAKSITSQLHVALRNVSSWNGPRIRKSRIVLAARYESPRLMGAMS
jgi:hypothetical protein